MIFEKKRHKEKRQEKTVNEWREAARRLDILMFFITVCIMTTSPLYFFVPYFFADPTENISSDRCACRR